MVSGSELPQALNPLPVEGLRLPEEVTRALRRVGLTTIGAFHNIGRQALVTRFCPSTLLRLDQAFGHIEETITPYRQPPPYSIRRALPEPVAHTAAIEKLVAELVTELCVRLQKDHTGARRLRLDCYRVDSIVSACGISTSKPVRSVKHLMRLFSEKIATIDAGFGIETLILCMLNFDRFDPAQLTLTHFDPDHNGDIEAFDELIDRIGMRLGFEHVSRLRVQQSFQPEFAVQFEPVSAPVTPNAMWPEYRLRPVYWVDPPIRIEVATIHPAGNPVQFRMGRDTHRIVKAEGPERLTPEWWRLEPRRWQVRDYYRIEDDRGCRFWIFQESDAAAAVRRWFLRGHLP
jgi:protein ImuB